MGKCSAQAMFWIWTALLGSCLAILKLNRVLCYCLFAAGSILNFN